MKSRVTLRFYVGYFAILLLGTIGPGPNLLAAMFKTETDITPPTVTAPVQTIAKGTVSSTVPIRLKWSASDAGGIKSYELWRSTNGGAFVRDTLLAPTATSRTYLLVVDNSYRFFVRAYDNAGNASAAKYGPTFTPTILDDRECCWYWARTNPWAPASLSEAYKGGVTKLLTYRGTTRGNYGYAVHDFTGRDVAYVATLGRGWVTASVKVDDVYLAWVDLGRDVTSGAQVVFSKHWSTLGAHMIEVAGSDYGYINVDAIVVIQ